MICGGATCATQSPTPRISRWRGSPRRCRSAAAALTLVTQNIDNLHEQAGSRGVIHMHGELLKARCELCGGVSEWLDDLHVADVCPRCGRAGGMRPHVVWFGELPLYIDEIERALRRSDLFVAIGTSGAVYPAAGFVLEARAMGIETCEINLEVGRQRRSLRRLPLRAGERNRAGVGRGNPRPLRSRCAASHAQCRPRASLSRRTRAAGKGGAALPVAAAIVLRLAIVAPSCIVSTAVLGTMTIVALSRFRPS